MPESVGLCDGLCGTDRYHNRHRIRHFEHIYYTAVCLRFNSVLSETKTANHFAVCEHDF